MCGLPYLSCLHRKEDCPSYKHEIATTVNQLQQWKKVFAKGKRAMEVQRLSKLARKGLTASNLPNLSKNTELLAFFFSIVDKAK